MSTPRLLKCVLVLASGVLAACGNDVKTAEPSANTGSTADSGAHDDGGSAGRAARDAGEKSDASSGTASGRRDAGPRDAGSDEDEDAASEEEPTYERPHDGRKFMIDEAALPFEALPNADAWSGKLGGAGYRVEVPHDWNGMLVMYAHGYAGTGNVLGVTTPSIRQYLIENGYAWAASSYSTNYYDVRAGVEDTNALALAFKKIAADNGRTLDEPSKRYIIGHSMGGHVTGAAIEREALETAVHKVEYNGAVPMCGVMGDTELFNFFTAFQWAAEKIAGVPYTTGTVKDPAALRKQLQAALFTTYPSELSWAGTKVRDLVRNLTGGDRPGFDAGYAAQQWQDALWSTVGGDGTINGILAKPVTDTREIVYQFDADAALSEEETLFNDEIYRSKPADEANGLRKDGLRWIPKVNGEFTIPVVSLHTLGDLYVPFKMQQIYRARAEEKGNGALLVQRAIRGTGHCEFTVAEQVAAFDAMVRWEQDGVRPYGDDVTDAFTISRPLYGCTYTETEYTDQERERGLPEARAALGNCN
jgi:pimeloyl-ACP methyl ester carboxylesterase